MRTLLPPPGGPMADDDVGTAYPWPSGPWVRALMVASADGSAVGPDGRSGSISGPADRLVLRTLRADADAVLVGAGTVRAERYRPPRLAPDVAARREAEGRLPAHRIAVLTNRADLPLDLPLLAEAAEPLRPLVLTCSAADAGLRAALAGPAEVVVVGDASVDLVAALAALRDRGLERVVAEGGPSLLGMLVAQGLVDEVDLTISPILVGGQAHPRFLAGPSLGAGRPLGLAGLLEADGMLFARYLLR